MKRVVCWMLSVAVLTALPSPVVGQVLATPDSTAPTPNTQHPTPPLADSLRRPTTPMGAMFRSFLIPGWGQAVYGRKVTAGIMIGFEGLSLGMLLKVGSEMDQIPASDS